MIPWLSSATCRPILMHCYGHCLFMLRSIMIVKSLMQSRYLLRCFSFDKSQFLLLSTTKERIFEDQHLIVLLYLVEVVHVQLHIPMFTCLTKDEKLEWRKYLGSISLVKLTTSITMNPISSLSQQMIFLFSGCLLSDTLLLRFNKSSKGRKLLCRYFCLYFDAAAPSFIITEQFLQVDMTNLGLTIRIPKESIIKLGDLQDKEIVVKFNGGREVRGKLKSWDKPMNLILEDAQQILGVENGVEQSRTIGLIIVKGTQFQTICLKNGYEVIENPYTIGEEEN